MTAAQTLSEFRQIKCRSHPLASGKSFIEFDGGFLPPVAEVYFGLILKADITDQLARALSDKLTKHCFALFTHEIDPEVSNHLLQLDPATSEMRDVAFEAHALPSGQVYISLGHTVFGRVDEAFFQLALTAATTFREAAALARDLNTHCSAVYSREDGLKITDIVSHVDEWMARAAA